MIWTCRTAPWSNGAFAAHRSRLESEKAAIARREDAALEQFVHVWVANVLTRVAAQQKETYTARKLASDGGLDANLAAELSQRYATQYGTDVRALGRGVQAAQQDPWATESLVLRPHMYALPFSPCVASRPVATYRTSCEHQHQGLAWTCLCMKPICSGTGSTARHRPNQRACRSKLERAKAEQAARDEQLQAQRCAAEHMAVAVLRNVCATRGEVYQTRTAAQRQVRLLALGSNCCGEVFHHWPKTTKRKCALTWDRSD